MIRTTCPKCGREDAVADYLAVLPILCNGCGTRVTVGEPIQVKPTLAPPVAPPPVPPPPKVVAASPPPPKPAPPPPPPKVAVPPPPPKPKAKPKPAPPPHPPVAPPVVAVLEEQVGLEAATETPLELAIPTFPRPTPVPVIVPLPEEPPFPLPLAGVGRRLLARFLFVVGLALMGVLGFGIIILGGSALRRDLAKDKTLAGLILAVPPAIYLLANAAMLARTGQDVGKRYAGVRVVNADGSKATEKTALLKRDALTFVIGLTGVGLLYWLADFVTLFGKGGRCLHDRIAGTRVVRA